MAVAINTVYIIPPGQDLGLVEGRLRLSQPTVARGHRLPIDGFFTALARERREAAIGIVLSGTGSDGAQGVLAIKAAGGLVMVQSPGSTEFDGMPRAALATGAVDRELLPQEMAACLIAVARGELPRSPIAPDEPAAPGDEVALKKVFALLLAKTRHDFSHYKATTVRRRIQRQMVLHQIATMEAYASYLQQSAQEVHALLRDLLIGVTSFFRDAEAFRVLEQEVIPTLFAHRAQGEPLRVWVAGCSSGEEAYSIAMLLLERLDEPVTPQLVQVFATDIDGRAIAVARAGVYPAAVAEGLGPERLARHFTREPGGTAYRVRKTLRDMLVFSEHNLARDPPFSRLDLVSCRNVLIYMDMFLHKRIIPMFHYGLKPGGVLFLGTSESIGGFDKLFTVLDRKAKLYRRSSDSRGEPPSTLASLHQSRTATTGSPSRTTMPRMTPSLRELTERALLRQLPLAAALVNAQGDIQFLHGRTGMYLEPSPGEVGTSNILAMAREGLRPSLSLALAQAVATRQPVACRGLRVKTNGHHTLVNLSVSALEPGEEVKAGTPLFLVQLEEAAATELPAPAVPVVMALGDPAPPADGADTDARVAALTQALRVSQEQLQSLHEELESSIEELKSSNEEMQSVNEELQSTNEELETSKEELQSVNEELHTVNAELENKVSALSLANDDMNNLLAGTGIATVFVDHGLRILRFTPGASDIINLQGSDIGRPVGHLAPNLEGYHGLATDTRSVLDSLIPKEQEVRSGAGRSYTMRIQPYRTVANVIEGAVITFVDISDMVRTRLALKQVNEVLRLAVVVTDAFDAVTVHALDGRTLAWNPAASLLYGWTEAQALALNLCDRVPAPLRGDALADLHRLALAGQQGPHQTQRLAQDGRTIEVWVKATALQDDDGQVYAIATTERATTQARGNGA